MSAYLCIVVSATAGYFSGPWWAALLSGLALALMSIAEQQKLRARFAAVGSTEVLMVAALAGVANGCVVAAGAYAMGRIVSWVFPF